MHARAPKIDVKSIQQNQPRITLAAAKAKLGAVDVFYV